MEDYRGVVCSTMDDTFPFQRSGYWDVTNDNAVCPTEFDIDSANTKHVTVAEV
jgi:hypothetical protein